MSSEWKGRTCVVTGCNTGIGRVTAEALGRLGATVLLANRSEEKTRPVLEAIRAAGGTAEFVALDLGSLAAVRRAAAALQARGPLHLLVNNAGLAGSGGQTKDGFELAFGTNHLGPFLLTTLLLPQLEAAGPGARIVNVSSRSHYRAKAIDWEALRRPTRSTTGLPEYEVSKLCNVLFTRSLARRLREKGVEAFSLHPGVVATDIWRSVPFPLRGLVKLFMISEEEGAKTSIHCATSPEAKGHSGAYFDKCRPKHPSRLSQDDALADELWRRSEEWTRA
jgi:retinol dehydrogenase-12